jgi:hypothetical protein
MNTEPYISFMQTTIGVEIHIRCGGKLWVKEHLSFPEALNFAVQQTWLGPEDDLATPAKLKFGWSKAIETSRIQLEMLGFRSIGTL